MIPTTTTHILQIDTEKQLTAATRILNIFSRRRLVITELQTLQRPHLDYQRFTVTIEATPEMILPLARKIEREIDVLRVEVFQAVSRSGLTDSCTECPRS